MICQHCLLEFKTPGNFIIPRCEDCRTRGHSNFKHDCPVCNPQEPEKNDLGIRLKIKPIPKKAA